MKILIAYDGSESSDAALEDLQRAGLPRQAEALIISVADVFLPPPLNEDIDDTFPMHIPAGVRHAHERAKHALHEAELRAQSASQRLKKIFPDWKIVHEALADSPAWATIRKAEEFEADLIVTGAIGHTVLGGRLILGSVSQRVLYEARTSVRIGRGHKRTVGPIRLLIGVDGSSDSLAAIETVARRDWPGGTEVRLLAVVDTVMGVAAEQDNQLEMKWIEVDDPDNWDQVRQLFQPSTDKLRGKGMDAAVMIRRGNPREELIDEAETWGADCIFLGAKGMRGIARLLLGSVSAGVAARSSCSVEVVRPR
jgi:nucleotide-binding universal stress UspA family protein